MRAVAQALAVSTATVYRLCNEGRLRHLRVANSVRVSASDLRAFMEGGGGA